MTLADDFARVLEIDRRSEAALDLNQERRDRYAEKGEREIRGLCRCGCGEKTPIAQRSNPSRGYAKGEPANYVVGHQRRKSPLEYLIDRESGCWLWQRATNNFGYGQMTVDGRVVYAHRRYYELHHGPISPNHVVDHLCANPSCVNPAHLEAITSGENIRRGSRGRPSVRKRAADERAAVHVLYDVNRTGDVTPAPVDPPDVAA